MEQDGSEPERLRGACIVPMREYPSNSIPSEEYMGISQRTWDPRNNSVAGEHFSGALGVRRIFCFKCLFNEGNPAILL